MFGLQSVLGQDSHLTRTRCRQTVTSGHILSSNQIPSIGIFVRILHQIQEWDFCFSHIGKKEWFIVYDQSALSGRTVRWRRCEFCSNEFVLTGVNVTVIIRGDILAFFAQKFWRFFKPTNYTRTCSKTFTLRTNCIRRKIVWFDFLLKTIMNDFFVQNLSSSSWCFFLFEAYRKL
jgi:hypothetical protein